MIGKIKRQITIKFNTFIMVFTIALIFQPIFYAFDSFCNLLRFGQHSSLVQKLVQLYLIFLFLFYVVSQIMKITFHHRYIIPYLSYTLVLKYIFYRFFMQKVRERWVQIVNSINSNEHFIVNTALYLFVLLALAKAINVLKRRSQKQAKDKQGEELVFQS